jgi:hypothetical protein
MSPEVSQPSICLLTMSYRGDLELCQLLCRTIDAFVPATFEHVLAVPRADLKFFAPLGNARRRLITQDELLPSWLFRLPMPPPGIRRAIGLSPRNFYVTRSGRLVRGWVAQQLMKIEAARRSEADVVLHVDSDAAFVRPLGPAHLVESGRVRLLRTEGAGDTPMHHPWHLAASRLFGLPERRYHGADYIGNLAVWRPAIVRAMLDTIASVQGGDAFKALAETKDISEYTLYGVYCDRIRGLADSGHWGTDRLLCATIWPGEEPSALRSRLAGIEIDDDQVAIGVQSTIPVSLAERRALVSRLSSQTFL